MGIPSGPIMGRLRGGVDYQRNIAAQSAKRRLTRSVSLMSKSEWR